MSGPSGFEKIFYLPRPVQVLDARRMTPQEVLIDLEPPTDGDFGYEPGQFVQLTLPGFGEVPISVCSSPTRSDRVQLCVRASGNVTRALQRVRRGDWLALRGPYGRGFPLVELAGKDLVIVAGGLGIAPLRSLIDFIADRRDRFQRVVVIYGARNPAALLFDDDLARWTDDKVLELVITVDEADDQWQGRTGVATEPLRELELQPKRTLAVVVGPPVLFRFAAMELFDHGLDENRIFFSLERNFHCGIGKCGHCQLNDLYVCRDGPVFRLSRLLKRIEAVEVWSPEEDQDR